ncbi:MAG: hypothetical protein GY804_08125 [Alphaproteobacteria bacterium]|nr:hypothetical protein [Alphaproteobacteria bacterium]
MKKIKLLLCSAIVISATSLSACMIPYHNNASQRYYSNQQTRIQETPPIIYYNPPLDAVSIVPIAKMEASFLGNEWDGITIPGRQICRRDGGQGNTPPLRITNIPKGTDVIIMEFNDSSDLVLGYDGSHGKIGVWHDGTSELNVAPISGETLNLPKFAFVEQLHRFHFSRGSAYMPPCSQGAGHQYFVKIKAVNIEKLADNRIRKTVLDEEVVQLGKY